MTIKSYRGLIPTDSQEHIRLKTLDGSKGYRIRKFQVLDRYPVTGAPEAVVKIYSIKQAAVGHEINFSDPSLLAAAFLSHGSTNATYEKEEIIFIDKVFNQDIYITSVDTTDSVSMNYYLELEVVDLRDNENEYITLRDIKATLPQHG